MPDIHAVRFINHNAYRLGNCTRLQKTGVVSGLFLR